MATQRTIPDPLGLGPADEFASARLAEPFAYEREVGRIVVASPEGQRHLDDSKPWRRRLSRSWIEHPEVVEELVVRAWIRVDDGTDRLGDIGIYLVVDRPALPIPDRVPELVFEVVSPGRESRHRDDVTKRRVYFTAGVREYVVIDPERKSVSVFTGGPRGFRRRTLRGAGVYRTPLLPGLVIPLDEVF